MGIYAYRIKGTGGIRMKIELTEQDLQNLIGFLDRVEVKGIRESQIFLAIINKLGQQAKDNETNKKK